MVDSPTGRTVLVTGGAGFIGSHLIDALVAENDVRTLDRLCSVERSNFPPEVTVIEGDIRDTDTLSRALRGVDVVYHQAAIVSVQESVEDPSTSHAVNCSATLDLFERAREEDARVVLASSASVYGHPIDVPIEEGEPPTPTSPYGVQKLAADRYAQIYHDLYGLETVALRYFNVYGPGQTASDYSGVIGVFLERAQNGDPIPVYGDGRQTRDFVHVDDVVQANLSAANTDAVGEAYNVGTGEGISIRQLAENIRDLTDSDSDIVHVDSRSGDVTHSIADIGAARRHLDFEPSVPLVEGLRGLYHRDY